MSLTNPLEIAPGSHVTLHLSLASTDGLEAISTFGQEPLEFAMGDGTLQPGLEIALYGLKSGDKQTLTLEPEQAYGLHDDELIYAIDQEEFPDKSMLKEGQVISFSLPNGEETLGTIVEMDDDEITVDFNHPLAGHSVVFSVEVIEVAPSATQ